MGRKAQATQLTYNFIRLVWFYFQLAPMLKSIILSSTAHATETRRSPEPEYPRRESASSRIQRKAERQNLLRERVMRGGNRRGPVDHGGGYRGRGGSRGAGRGGGGRGPRR